MSDDRENVADADEETVVDEQETETEPEADEPAEGEEPEAEEAEDQPEGDEPAEGETEVEAEPQGGRRETRVQRLANERRQLREDKARLERELAEARAPRQQQPQETPQQRQERLALMDPEQRTQYLLDEQAQHFNIRQTNLERTVLATADKSAFETLCSRKPHFEAVREDVEAEFNRLLQQGRYVPRETLAKYVIGDRIDKRGGAAKGQQARRGRERIAGQRARAPGGGSDVAAERRPRGDDAGARERRLRDQEI